MKKLLPYLLSLSLLVFFACNTSKSASSQNTNDVDTAYGSQDSKTYTGNAKSLKTDKLVDGNIIDMLRRTPGLRVTGTANTAQVTVIGTPATQMTTMSPLFVIDGNRVGHDVAAIVSAVNVTEVKRITVLKDPADTGIYGVDGTNGVIMIKTKKK